VGRGVAVASDVVGGAFELQQRFHLLDEGALGGLV
jgi:hypothetical protein